MDLTDSQSQLEKVTAILTKHGISEFGFAELDQSVSLDKYDQWLDQGHQGEMTYLERHRSLKRDPAQRFPGLRSAIVFRQHYFKSAQKLPKIPALKVALYAQSLDYHERIPKLVEPVLQELHQLFPEQKFVIHTDSAPILERDLAYRAGLGWFGKNSMLIDEKVGSFFFIAEILTSLPLASAQVLHPDRCGTCTRCIDACPTDAIIPGRTIDARRCISYLNIESKTLPAEPLREGMGSWFFGCDICQLVCPWNEKVFGKATLQDMLRPDPSADIEVESDLAWVLRATETQIQAAFKDYPLSRPKPWGLKRNALVLAGNLRLVGLRDDVESLLEDARLRPLAEWALERLPPQ